MVYKKINGTLKEIKIETSQDENPKKLFPILREKTVYIIILNLTMGY